MKTIQLNNLSIGYPDKKLGKKYIARNIHAVLNGGELTCLLGANGAGKSTLLRTLSGFLPPLEGEILLQGKSLMKLSDTERARTIGVVLTERPELHHLSVSELAGMGRSPYTGFWGRLSESDKAIVNEALNMVGMEKMAMRLVDTLSDGERQKVMIAKALAQQTPVIFLDEPTAFLDYPSKVETMLLLRRLAHETGKTIFLSTHDVELALQTADTLWLMRRVRSEDACATTGNSSSTDCADNAESLLGRRDAGTQEVSPSSVTSPLTIGSPRELADMDVLGQFFVGKEFTFDKEEMRFRIK